MSKIRITDRWLQALKPLSANDPGYRKVVWDAGMPGLCVRPGQRVTFYVGKRPTGSKQFVWVKLGDYPALSLAEARAQAAVTIASIGDGRPILKPTATGLTFADAAAQYLRECLDGKRTRVEIEQIFHGKLVPALGTKPLAGITHEDIVAVLRMIADRPERHAAGRLLSGGPHAARKALVHLHGMLRWCAFNRIGGLQSDPSAAIPARELLRGRQFNRQRKRVLADKEVRVIWQAAETYGYPFGTLIRALLLTGQRLCEIADARRDELDGGCLVVPAARMKSKQAHAVPLTARTQALFDGLPRFSDGMYLFSTMGGTRPISGFSKYKMRFDRAVAAVGAVEPWQIHDLRRTVRTGLSRAGVPVFAAELTIAHTQAGVHAVYDLHRYAEEKRTALQQWEQLLVNTILGEI